MISGAMTDNAINADAAARRYNAALVEVPQVLELAAQACRVPMAAIKLIGRGNGQFAASLGILNTADVPQSKSVCNLIAAADRTIVVDDASADLRLQHHPLVTGSDHVRFLGAAPLHHDGRPVGALCVFDDRPRRHDTELTNRLLTRIARQVDAETGLRHLLTPHQPSTMAARQDDVLAAISHEVRTPLACIRGNLELLTGTPGAITPGFERQTDAITRHVDRLCRTMENLLTVADQQLHEPVGQRDRIELSSVVSTAVHEAPDPTGQIRTVLPAAPLFVSADHQLLHTAIGHLLSNALLFGGTNQPVEVTLYANPQPTITIIDHGPGLDPPQLTNIGVPFQRGEMASRNQIPGLGLGLAITRRILEAQDAHLEIHSAPGAGTNAKIIFPACRSDYP